MSSRSTSGASIPRTSVGSPPDPDGHLRTTGTLGAALKLLLLLPAGVGAQVEERAVLDGTVYVGDTALAAGTVVLHHLSDSGQGEVDSLRVAGDGSFSFVLPNVPDPARGDVFFASVRHAGVLYFGPAITTAVQLDSVYEIHAYDTIVAPAEGIPIAVQSRSLFLEPDGVGAWRATDLFQLRNDRDRTVVARAAGRTWSYPLPAEARDVAAGEGDLSFDAATYEDGEIVVRAALPPGERLFVVRYRLDAPFVSFPTPGTVETIDVLVREPAPPLEVDGLELVDQVELEPGSTYRRFSGVDFERASIRILQVEERGPPPVQWFAVLLALILMGGGLLALRGGVRAPVPASVRTEGGGGRRQDLLTRIARLDEEFEAIAEPTDGQRRAYRRRRSDLIDRLRREAGAR